MRGAPGIAATVFGALGEAGINVIAISQGSSERNISLVVTEHDAAGAVRAIHRAFQLDKTLYRDPNSRGRVAFWALGVGSRALRENDLILARQSHQGRAAAHDSDGCGRVGGERCPDISPTGRPLAPVSRLKILQRRSAFARDPRLVWEWYAWRRELIAACRPNAAHDVIAAWSRPSRGQRPGCRVVTQNVDDLHLQAGTRELVRMHGSIWELSCWGDVPPARRHGGTIVYR